MAKVSISAKALVPHDCMNCQRHIRLAETWNQPPRGLLVKSVFPPNLQIKDEACVWRTMPTSWDSIFFFHKPVLPFSPSKANPGLPESCGTEGCRLFASLWNLDIEGYPRGSAGYLDYQRFGTSPKCRNERTYESCNSATYKGPSGDCCSRRL